jgi:hypothetical protein
MHGIEDDLALVETDRLIGRLRRVSAATTAGEEVGDADTYPAQVQAMLRARYPGLDVRVIKAGVPSYRRAPTRCATTNSVSTASSRIS